MSYLAKHKATKNSQAASDWAAKRRAAVEKAKRLREERRKGELTDDHRFVPATNPRPAPSSNGVRTGGREEGGVAVYAAAAERFGPYDAPPAAPQGGADALDAVAAAQEAHERAVRARRVHVPEEEDAYGGRSRIGKVPSPGSDALTYEMRKAGVEDRHDSRGNGGSHLSADAQRAAAVAADAAHAAASAAAAEADAAFYGQLRGGGSRDRSTSRPEWNMDTESASDGTFGAPPAVKPSPARRSGGSGGRRGDRSEGRSSHRTGADDGYYDSMRDAIGRDPAAGGTDVYHSPAKARVSSSRRGAPSAPDAGDGGDAFGSRRSPIDTDQAPPPLPTGARRGSGRFISAEEIEARAAGGGGRAGGVARADSGRVPSAGRRAAPPSMTGRAASARGSSDADRSAPSGRKYPSSARAASPVAVDDLEHEVAAPKLRLLKRRIKSGRRMKRTASGGDMGTDGSGPDGSGSLGSRGSSRGESSGASSARGDRGSRRGASSAGLTRRPRDEFGGRPQWDDGAEDAAPSRDAPRALSRGSRGSPPKPQSRAQRDRSAPAAAAAPAAPADECTRRSDCTCRDCAAASMAVAAPVQPTGGYDEECQRNSSCNCRDCAAANEALMRPAARAVPAPAAASAPLQECRDCGRKFNEKAFVVHRRVCRKVFVEKRKKFDAKAQMLPEEAAKVAREGGSPGSRAGGRGRGRGRSRGGGRAGGRPGAIGGAKKGKWAAQSSQLRQALQAARAYKVAEKTGDFSKVPTVPSAPVDDLTQCPHCGRRFNETAAERHIPRCKDIVAKPKTLVRGQSRGLGAASRAKERRTVGSAGGFGAPPPIRGRRR